MKQHKIITLTELAKRAGSKRKLTQLAGIQNLGSINQDSVLIDGVLFCPSKSTADWCKVWDEYHKDIGEKK